MKSTELMETKTLFTSTHRGAVAALRCLYCFFDYPGSSYLREYWGILVMLFVLMRRDFDGALSIFERNDCFNIVVVRCGDTHQIE